MLYTTIEAFKQALDTETAVAAKVAELNATMESVSRSIDRYCTGQPYGSDNYFELDDVVDELLPGQIDSTGNILCYPRKPKVTAVSAISYRLKPADQWTEIPEENVTITNAVKLWVGSGLRQGPVLLQLSYTGGLSSTSVSLPADFRDAATVLSVRFYKEVKSGLGDSIGVAELGTMVYTKAWPERVRAMLQPYVRTVPWT
jgi:hypothetical protein